MNTYAFFYMLMYNILFQKFFMNALVAIAVAVYIGCQGNKLFKNSTLALGQLSEKGMTDKHTKQ